MLRRLLALPLAMAAATACATPEPPQSAGGEADPRVTSSLDATTPPATVVPNPTAFAEGKPCELLTPEDTEALGLRPPSTRERTPPDLKCHWPGADFGLIVTIDPARSLDEVDAARPGRRITITGRAALMTRGEGQDAGVCELALHVTGTASVDIFLTRRDKHGAACLNAVKVAALLHPRLPGA